MSETIVIRITSDSDVHTKCSYIEISDQGGKYRIVNNYSSILGDNIQVMTLEFTELYRLYKAIKKLFPSMS